MFVLFCVVVCVVVVRLTDQLLWIKFVCLAVESQQVKGGIVVGINDPLPT